MFNAQNRIRQLMAERGWTIYRLAQESGLSQTTISNIFKRNNQPSLPTVNAICDACGITLAQFFTENDTANRHTGIRGETCAGGFPPIHCGRIIE